MRITPAQASYRPDGPPPRFVIETGGYPFFAVQLTSEAVLLNGANAGRRTPRNFFDSWNGDALFPPSLRPTTSRVAGEQLEAPTGQAQYTLPATVWARLRHADRLFYRLIVGSDPRRRRFRVSVEDVDWARAPSIAIAHLPAQPVQSPTARFRGRGALQRSDLVTQATPQVRQNGLITGRDGDFRYVLLDARRYDLAVLECHVWGLTDTVARMPRKPDAVINGQFIASPPFGIATEGQVIREGALIHADSHPTRYYLAQTWRSTDSSGYRVGQGNPQTAEPDARVAFGGLGPVLLGGAPPASLTAWARSIYNLPDRTGRGVIAIERDAQLIALIVQENSSFLPTNPLSMTALQGLLRGLGFDDAIFNDGSDSEALFASGGWLLEPGYAKDESMDFALSFVERGRSRRIPILAIDGTSSRDAEALARGLARPYLTHYAPRNISEDLRHLPALAPIAGTFRSGVIEAYRTTGAAQARQVEQVIELAGLGGHWADLLYVSSHAWRHGQLFYHEGGGETGPLRVLADPWSSFRPVWRSTPRWLILAGCAVLALRYSRGLRLTAAERAHLVDWHRAIHGPSAAVPGLTAESEAVFPVYHPGWAWYDRIFRPSTALRGVLGYWYRSPGGGRDVEIIDTFSTMLREGATLLQAWDEANRRGIFEADAAWAAMVREGCAGDTLATLEQPALPAASGPFRYYDRHQRGRLLPDAYREANRRPEVERIGAVSVRHNPTYDSLAIEELQGLPVSLTPANFLIYDDGVGP